MKLKALALTFVLVLLFSVVGAQFVVSVAGNPSNLPEKPSQIYIKPDGSIEPSSAPIQRSGNTYTLTNDTEHSIVMQCSNIVFDGNGFSITQIPVNISGLTVPAGWYPGIQVPDRVANVTIKNVKIRDCISGVSLENASNITLENIGISGVEKVVVFSGYSSNCTFSKNDLRSGTEGILLIDSKHIDIYENTIASNRVGISCYSSTFPSNGADGFACCAYINIFGNNIASNYEAGISLRAYNVRVGYNKLANNNYGVQFTSNSYYTLFYSNNFVDNSKNVKINILASGGDGTWVWDSGSSGNYWSDYTTKYPNAMQIDHTGIGDTPYVIDDFNKDNYPLIKEASINPPYAIVDFPSPLPSASPSPTQTAASTPTPDTSTTPTDEQTEAEPAPTLYLTLIVVGCGVLLAFASAAVLIYHKRARKLLAYYNKALNIRCNKFKIVSTAVLLIGIIFVFANFTFPHTVLVQKPIQVSIPHSRSIASLNYSILNGNMFYPPLQPTAVTYYYLSTANVTEGQTLHVTWYADISLGVYIFTEEQFANFQSTLPHTQGTGNTPDATEWANKNGIAYEAAGWARKNGEVSYNVSESGDYVAVITNAMYGGAFAQVHYFDEYLVTYTFETQYVTQTANDNLYFYLGIVFLILGLIVFAGVLRHQKQAQIALGQHN